jgi:hypothetical protein
MLQRIANLLGLAQPKADPRDSLPCLYSIAEDNVRVDVLEYLLPCGHCAYAIRGEYFVEEFNRWEEIADLRDFNVTTAAKLFGRAAEFVSALNKGLVSSS